MFNKDALQQLYRYAYSLTGDEHDAYDLLQGALENFIKMKVDATKPMAYLKKVIYNRFVDNCRREKVIQFESTEEADLPADFDVQTLDEILVNENMAEKIIQSLDPCEREIMYCWAIEGFSTSEVANKLDMPKGTVLSKIYRMRKKLIEKYAECSSDIVEAEL